ncbi:DUF3572 domain-containing protein [Chthonobacter albigriseus]|uniref:DUF3572 domain-containing protein n=1 Tax=Chthonobacter albigriseus TaxID=1683161 RepID=UPI001FCE3124|nr:DUF3572 domain-containing protein [Chthonobacter albigriseus]
MAGSNRLTREKAEEIAILGLQFLVGDPEQLGRFLALTGIGPLEIRSAAAEPGFLAGVLEFFMADESLLLSFAASRNLRPMMIAAARHVLAGEAGF